MKTTFKSVVVALALAASAVASATPLNNVYTSSDNKVFSIENVREIEFTQGSVRVVFVNGSNSYNYIGDASGSVAAKIKASPLFTQFVQLPNTSKFYRPAFASYITCSNSQTTVGWSSGQSETFVDGCAFYQAVKAVTN